MPSLVSSSGGYHLYTLSDSWNLRLWTNGNPLDVKDADPPEGQLIVQRLDYPPERAEGWILGEGADAVPELVQLLRDEANVL